MINMESFLVLEKMPRVNYLAASIKTWQATLNRSGALGAIVCRRLLANRALASKLFGVVKPSNSQAVE
jgi:hypothetical protein